jgi:DnaJ like chaperone protein
MGWIGKIIGSLVGFFATRSLWGAMIGGFVGHLFDLQAAAARPAAAATISEVFFRATFELMGHVAKSDGRVSEAEIDAARRLMVELRLSAVDVDRAIGHFRAGKAASYDLEPCVERLREACGQRHDVLRTFMELQLRAALAGNGLSPPARRILTHTAGRLGMSGLEFAHLEAAIRARREGGGNRPEADRGGGKSLAACYAELEVDATMSNQEITKAYRRQMSRHHPDKLVANGLPDSMAQIAKEKTQRIQEAYECIRAARGMR